MVRDKFNWSIMAPWVFAVVFLWNANTANAQKARFGLMASSGVSILKSDNNQVVNDGIKLDFNYGLMFDYDFQDNYGLSTGFFVNHFGGKLNYKSDNIKYNINLQYLEVPLTVKMKTNEIGYITYWGQIGIAPDVRIRARADVTTPDTLIENLNVIESHTVNNQKLAESKLFNLSLFIGGGIEYGIGGKTAILVGLYFSNGFVNIIKDEDGEKTVLRSPNLRLGVIF